MEAHNAPKSSFSITADLSGYRGLQNSILLKISSFLIDNSTLTDEIQQALPRGKKKTSATGITSEQVLTRISDNAC